MNDQGVRMLCLPQLKVLLKISDSVSANTSGFRAKTPSTLPLLSSSGCSFTILSAISKNVKEIICEEKLLSQKQQKSTLKTITTKA